MPLIHWKQKEIYGWICLFFVGVILGILYVKALSQGVKIQIQQEEMAVWDRLQRLHEWNGWRQKTAIWRMGLPVVWIWFSFNRWGTKLFLAAWVAFGFSISTLFGVLVGMAGWRGPFYLWALLFPQYLFYGPGLFLLFIGCLQWNQFWKNHRSNWYKKGFSWEKKLFVVRLVLGMLLYGLGIWAELYIHPWILKKIL